MGDSICVSRGRCFSALIMSGRFALCPSPGIMAILFSGIVMSHYTHHNLSPVTQILMQQTLRTVAFLCGELCLCVVRAGLRWADRSSYPIWGGERFPG